VEGVGDLGVPAALVRIEDVAPLKLDRLDGGRWGVGRRPILVGPTGSLGRQAGGQDERDQGDEVPEPQGHSEGVER
jgi:hypothetical protein